MICRFYAGPFLTMVQNCSGDTGPPWADEFALWYQPTDWINEPRAVAAFIGGKIAALKPNK